MVNVQMSPFWKPLMRGYKINMLYNCEIEKLNPLLRIYYNMKNNLINYRKHYDKPLLRSILGPLVILLRVSRANGLLYAFSLIIGKNKKIFFNNSLTQVIK